MFFGGDARPRPACWDARPRPAAAECGAAAECLFVGTCAGRGLALVGTLQIVVQLPNVFV